MKLWLTFSLLLLLVAQVDAWRSFVTDSTFGVNGYQSGVFPARARVGEAEFGQDIPCFRLGFSVRSLWAKRLVCRITAGYDFLYPALSAEFAGIQRGS
ncbi:MAG: hypothetical protein NWR72_00925 [Bacteroidia bacterium]|nr:hypothetical protein [Bacteroidia bacterium]